MVLINGRKFACEACIRGHRASSCAHTGRQLQQVRRKGRPSSQCDTCKAKRANGSFHGKCKCGSTGDWLGSSGGSASSPEAELGDVLSSNSTWKASMRGDEAWMASEKGRHSLEALMNPCRCKTTGICTCCRSEEDSKGDSGIAAASPPAPCCDGDKCCSDSLSTALTPQGSAQLAGKGGCCSGKKQSEPPRAAASSLLPARPSMTREEMEAIVSPPCHCGPNCSCPGCLRESDASRQERATMQANEECPDKCLTCSACAFGLTRPSGIEAVDKWMDKDKKEYTETAEQHELPPKKRAKVDSQGHTPVGSIPPPPLPPFPNAAHFFTSHFLDSARRKHFADQIKAADPPPEGVQAGEEDESGEGEYGSRRQGESDEDWQIRHGFYYLTPEAIRIFDSARKFREERQRQEEREEREEQDRAAAEQSAVDIDPPASTISPSLMEELAELRRKALSARKTQDKVPTQVA